MQRIAASAGKRAVLPTPAEAPARQSDLVASLTTCLTSGGRHPGRVAAAHEDGCPSPQNRRHPPRRFEQALQSGVRSSAYDQKTLHQADARLGRSASCSGYLAEEPLRFFPGVSRVALAKNASYQRSTASTISSIDSVLSARTQPRHPKKPLGHMSLSHFDFRWAPE
jgi:hypothetical protein